ncbi:altronate dehydratase family protein [Sphingosinicella sp. LHD-64]|uniref:UxaA family hydrolase n=1 Tax=Sphingosinicella sp. LHD-64 TaxID=3072139 RepID=UPI00280FBB1C|nr:altronate dehydratase family protein [Sphingosinicella sp. LHD-64]MDQ8756971.1 altronate dehydratase family protein [Sphingosinicella sp. LHD-64]
MSQAELQDQVATAPAALRLHPDDDVAVALRAIMAGEAAAGVTVAEAVPAGHKFALAPIASGQTVRKYGWPIGRASAAIPAGGHVHSHNLETLLSGVEGYHYAPAAAEPPAPHAATGFDGYRRPDGRVGTRNEIWILPTVGCVARTAERIAAITHARHARTIDGVHAFAHPHGCSQLGEDLDGTRAILAALACHPNAGGVLLVGLGCESNQLDRLMAEIPEGLRSRVRTLRAQEAEDEVEAGLAAVDALTARAAIHKRQSVPLSELVVGLKCGGSDGFSGLTANPLVGRIADRVIGAGGSAILTEIPEIFGAERLLMARARDRGVFDALVGVVNDFKRYFLEHGQPVSENPSPGNIAGGITTLEEKSLGAVQKAGRAPVADVLRYGARVRRKGLTLLEAPGNDAVSSTALAAAGATVILFTTGRGTPLGFPVPTVKIATNSALAARKPGWIDFDAGRVLVDGFDAPTDALTARIAAIASGTPTAAERAGERDIAIWKRGVTL